MRALGIDYGERRIGLALSDPTATIASPYRTLTYRAGKRPPVSTIERVARDEGVEHLVIGLPLDPSGRETDLCATVRELGDVLSGRLDVPVHFVDERMTSARAHRSKRDLGLPLNQRRRKEPIDAMAAALILQLWLDVQPGP